MPTPPRHRSRVRAQSAPASAAADEVDPAAAEAAALASAAASLGAEPPSIEMRVEAAKLLLECEMARAARRVLRGLVAEDDRVFDAWCLLGLSHVHCARGGSEVRSLHAACVCVCVCMCVCMRARAREPAQPRVALDLC